MMSSSPTNSNTNTNFNFSPSTTVIVSSPSAHQQQQQPEKRQQNPCGVFHSALLRLFTTTTTESRSKNNKMHLMDVSAWTPLLLRTVFVFIAAVVALNLNGAITPTRRGFHCGDASIAFPFRRSTVPYWRMVEAQNCVLIALIILTEWLASRSACCGGGGDKSVTYATADNNTYGDGGTPRRRFIRPSIVRILHWILLSVFGFALTIIVTEMIKVNFGCLRPNFLDVCRPNITDCPLSEYVLVADARGRVPDMDTYTLWSSSQHRVAVCLNEAEGRFAAGFVDDARKSFISGHTSTVFYYAVFTMIYMHVRTDAVVTRRFRRSGETATVLSLWRLCALTAQWTLLTAAALVGLSRIVDNKHHAEDVLFGALTGSAIAATFVLYPRRERTTRHGFSDFVAQHAGCKSEWRANGVAVVDDGSTPTPTTQRVMNLVDELN